MIDLEENMKAAVFFADGFEDIEALSPVDYLRRAGIEVTTVAVPSPTMKNDKMATSSHNVTMCMDMSIAEFKETFEDDLPDCVVCPGGSNGAKNLSNCDDVISFIKKMFAAGKLVGAICASPAVVLPKTEILKGKNWTCYPGCEESIEDLELIEDSTYCENIAFVTDGNLVTGRGPGASEEFSMELVRILCGDEVRAKVAAAAMMR